MVDRNELLNCSIRSPTWLPLMLPFRPPAPSPAPFRGLTDPALVGGLPAPDWLPALGGGEPASFVATPRGLSPSEDDAERVWEKFAGWLRRESCVAGSVLLRWDSCMGRRRCQYKECTWRRERCGDETRTRKRPQDARRDGIAA